MASRMAPHLHRRRLVSRIPRARALVRRRARRDVGTPRHARPAVAGALRRRVLPRQQLRLPGRRRERGLSACGGGGAQARGTLHTRDADGAREHARMDPRAPLVEGGRHASAGREPLRSGARSRRHRVHAYLKRPGGHATPGSHRAYTYRQLVELLEGAGFMVQTAEPWTRQAHNVSFIATLASRIRLSAIIIARAMERLQLPRA